MRRPLAASLIALILALAVTACGEKDESAATSTTTTSLTKEQWLREADKICKQSDDKIERASNQFFADARAGKEPPPSEVAKFGKQTVFPTIQDEIDRIRSLGAPAGDEGQVNAILDATQEGLDKLEQDPEQLAKGGTASAFEQAKKLAGDYGLDECANGG
jgi:hypothetical protein